MGRNNYIPQIANLSESEGIFTTAQAKRLGIPRDALHDAYAAGRLERVLRGAYRLVGSGETPADGLAATWKLTDPAKFTWERMRDWDGIVVGGSTAAAMLGIGDLYLSPYRIYAPRRINSRLADANFAKRVIAPEDVTWISGLPVTRPERTLIDLVLDDEDPSLVEDALADAAHDKLDLMHLDKLATSQQRGRHADQLAHLLHIAKRISKER